MPLKVILYSGMLPHHYPRVAAFGEGLKRHGVAFEHNIYDGKVYDCDLALFWSHRYFEVIQRQRNTGCDYLAMELGYIGDRRASWALGFNGLNGRADFVNADVPGDRWAQWADRMQPWRDGGEYVLIMGQVPGDASLDGVVFAHWAKWAAKEAGKLGFPVKYRMHPRGPYVAAPTGAELLGGDLDQALAGAVFVVTYNSNSSVDAVLAGVPTVAVDQGSMAWAVTGHLLEKMPPTPDRTDWARKLAYCQWGQDEISSGVAWEHLKRRFD